MALILAAVFAGLVGVLVPAPMGASFAQAQPPRPPELIEIVPDSGPAGEAYPLRATIRGVGFMPTGNVVRFGPAQITDVPSPDGTEITFQVPKLLPSKGEVPPLVLTPGDYTVTVTTASGTSNALTFRLTRGT
jgi:hypothetical protein